MIITSVALFILSFVAVMLVAGNNLSACIGPAIGSRILNKKFGLILGAVGFGAGLVIQGGQMQRTVNALFPKILPELSAEALLVAILIFVIADLFKSPVSYTMSLSGLLIGLSVASGTTANHAFLIETIAMWIITPTISIISVYYLSRNLHRQKSKNIWLRLKMYKILIIILSFLAAYVLGANTLGLIVATSGYSLFSLILAIIAIFLGCFLLSSGPIKRISQEIFLMRYSNSALTLVTSTTLVGIATIFNIPLSNTESLSAGIFGAALSYKTKFISLKPFLKIVVTWIIAPTLSFALGLIIVSLH